MCSLSMYCQTETVINLQDEEGFTPLMWAAAHGQIAVVEFLLQNVSKNCLGLSFRFQEFILQSVFTGDKSI